MCMANTGSARQPGSQHRVTGRLDIHRTLRLSHILRSGSECEVGPNFVQVFYGMRTRNTP